MKKFIALLLSLVMIMTLASCAKPEQEAKKEEPKKTEAKVEKTEKKEEKTTEKTTEKKEIQKLTLVLDWVPNTNHTGIFVAKDLGYFAEEGIEMEIVQPAEDSSSVIVGSGRAEFGIYFQPNMVKRLLKDTPITAVAAILQHNTGGIMALADSGIETPKDMAGKKFSTWEDPIDDATIKFMVEKDGGNWADVSLVPGESTAATTALRMGMFDSIFVYQGWDYIHSQTMGVETNFIPLVDYVKEFDYYTPVIIANDDFLKEKPELAKAAMRAIKKGYEYCIENPEVAAEVLIKNAPEGDPELIKASQKFLSTKYIDDAKSWGIIDPKRWDAFYAWLYEQKLIEKDLQGVGFSNDYLE